MFQTIYLGRLLGIKVYIHWSFWFLAIYVLLSSIGGGIGRSLYALGFVFAIFGCVFLHEMGHALAAKWYRIETLDITLLPIGGIARMEELPKAPMVELVVALAGPLVNLIIAMLLMPFVPMGDSLDAFYEDGPQSISFLEQLLVSNIVLALFNLLPSFPMDGGRVLRSILAMIFSYSRATIYTARTGQVMAVLMLIASYQLGLSLAIIAVFVFAVCSIELLKERIKAATQQIQGSQPPFWSGDHSTTDQPFDGQSDSQNDTIDAIDVRHVS